MGWRQYHADIFIFEARLIERGHKPGQRGFLRIGSVGCELAFHQTCLRWLVECNAAHSLGAPAREYVSCGALIRMSVSTIIAKPVTPCRAGLSRGSNRKNRGKLPRGNLIFSRLPEEGYQRGAIDSSG